MTHEELAARESIRDTIALAARAGDHLMVDDYAGCFAADGVLEYGEVMHHAGREAIRAWIARAARHADKRGLVRHNVTATVITLHGPPGVPDSAEAHSYYHVYSDVGPDHFGWYHDRFVPEDGRWLLARRTVGVDWVSPNSRIAKR